VTEASQETAERPAPSFAHASEAEMARILDFYAVRWQYEPKTFPILWNLEGDVVESFSPDFYLPDLDMFLEMTTLKQNLVRKKNRKLRRLRELYPDIRIKLFYARDFAAMMLKYGRFALVESLSGTVGQMVPDRPLVAGQVSAALAVEPATVDLATPPPAAPIRADGSPASEEAIARAPSPPPAGAVAPSEPPVRRSRTAARRLRRRHLRAAATAAAEAPAE
jgi:hypothetical protein